MSVAAEAVALCGLVLVHVMAGRMRFLDVIPRSRWLSGAAGASVAYVLLHLLPELGEAQRSVEEQELLTYLEDHVYVMVLVGLAAFYGVELASRRRASSGRSAAWVFWASVASFAVYNAVIGYLVVRREDETTMGLVFFTIALGIHFVINDHALRDRHRADYDDVGRWILIAAVAIGWAVGQATDVSEPALGLLVAFLAGGVILNVMKEELPEARQSRFWAFALGAILYGALLQLA